jgi:hypothetical protein
MNKPTSPDFAATLVHAATVLPMLQTLVRMRRARQARPVDAAPVRSDLAA